MNEQHHCKRVIYSAYSKSLTFLERNSRDLTLEKHALADVFKLDIIKDFAKFQRKHLHQILYLMNLRASSNIAKETTAQMLSSEFYEIFKNTFFIEFLQATTYYSSST